MMTVKEDREPWICPTHGLLGMEGRICNTCMRDAIAKFYATITADLYEPRVHED